MSTQFQTDSEPLMEKSWRKAPSQGQIWLSKTVVQRALLSMHIKLWPQVNLLEIENHLLGAYSYASSDPIDFSRSGILQTGAWNYLREEITVALIRRRGVRMGQIFDFHSQTGCRRVNPSDQITYLLAKIINFSFEDNSERQTLQERRLLWQSLRADIDRWEATLPQNFAPFSLAVQRDDPFPAIWMLQPCHVAAQQYRAVAEILLVLYNPSPESGHLSHRNLTVVENQALQICGTAWTNVDEAARVNAFGPLAFCGRDISYRRRDEEFIDY
ncbi:hypothetical protein E8E12_008123 [Didymella heteroderae]|uniref:Uncharacterized protein n=1 Tax=Didymella heteroderae TaxID=1769908 RepID=A0A9P5C014_9PLEO|nr:hypothetical protein E8E12_008123 [Didymella heteroderae]